MRNLLTTEEKKNVRREYRWRLVIISLEALLITFIIGLLCILPSYILSKAKERSVLARSEELHTGEVSKKIDAARAELSAMALRENYIAHTLIDLPASFIVDQVSKERGSAITLFGFDLKKDNNAIALDTAHDAKTDASAPFTFLTIVGMAKDRASLTAFAHRLEGLSFVKSVDVPVSNFEKGRGIDFSISIALK